MDDTASEATAWSHTGLPAETERHYRVSAINAAGTSDPSDTASATTSSQTVDAEVWSGTLTVQDLGSSVLGCDNTASDGACSDASVLSDDDFDLSGTDFAIAKVRLSSGGNLLLNLDIALTTAAESLTLHVAGTAFAFEGADDKGGFGRAWRGSGLVWTAGDTVALQLTVPVAAPGAPTGLTAAASGGSQIDLAWTAPADEGGSAITGYRIEVSSDGGSSWEDLVADTGDAFTNYRHTGIPPGAERHYRVSAINAAGLSDPSGTASATTTSQTVEVEVWSGTLTVQDLGSSLLGCDNTAAGGACSDASVLSDDDFYLAGTDFALAGIRLGADGALELSLDTGLTAEAESLTLRAGGINFAFENADVKGADSRLWQNPGFGWTADDTVALQLTATAPEVPGTLLFSGTLVAGTDTKRSNTWTGYSQRDGRLPEGGAGLAHPRQLRLGQPRLHLQRDRVHRQPSVRQAGENRGHRHRPTRRQCPRPAPRHQGLHPALRRLRRERRAHLLPPRPGLGRRRGRGRPAGPARPAEPPDRALGHRPRPERHRPGLGGARQRRQWHSFKDGIAFVLSGLGEAVNQSAMSGSAGLRSLHFLDGRRDRRG